MEMKIGADLRLAFPVRWVELPVLRKLGESDEDWAKREGETTLEPSIWAYHTPINRSVFEANYRAISAAYTSIWSKGQLFVLNTGPIIATLALRSAAREDALESGVDMKGDAAMPLLSEIKRLTMIVAPGKSGYDPLPVDVAIRQNVIDAEDWTEAEAAVVFFYLRILDGEEEGPAERGRRPCQSGAQGVDYVIGAYGVHRFLTDVDASRDFRGPDTVVSSVLDWAATEGFAEMMERSGITDYATPLEWRQRYLLRALKRLAGT